MAFPVVQALLVLLKLTHVLADSYTYYGPVYNGPVYGQPWNEQVHLHCLFSVLLGHFPSPPLASPHFPSLPLASPRPQELAGDAQLGALDEVDGVDGEEGQQVLQWTNARDFYHDEPAMSEYTEEEDFDVEETYANLEEMEEIEPEAEDDEEEDFAEVMPVEEDDFAEEKVYEEHQVDDVEEAEAIDLGEELSEIDGDFEKRLNVEEEAVELKDAEEEEVDIDFVEDVTREEDESVGEFLAVEERHGEETLEEVGEEEADVTQTCWVSDSYGAQSCLNLDPATAVDRMLLVMLENRKYDKIAQASA